MKLSANIRIIFDNSCHQIRKFYQFAANIIFLIKSIMNKKLFSWKALAGLALLVAMGLTSCKQGTEVDPNDPYNTKTPTQPGTSTKGGDLVFTITKSSDITSLWASYDATKKAELMKKTTLNIVINSGSYKLDGGVLILPKFFNTTANSVLNLTFNGSFLDTDKNPLALDASSNLDGAKVNIVLPGQSFNMILDAAKVAATLSSEGVAAIGTFKAIANTKKENALTIGSGVTVKGIDDSSTGAIVKNGGDIVALILNATPKAANYETKKGFKIGNGEIFATSLIVNAAGISITNDKDTPLGDITINKGCDATFTFGGTTVNSITGTKANESTVTFKNIDDKGVTTYSADALKNIGSIKNVTINNGGTALTIKKDIFESVLINEGVTLETTTFAGVDIAGDININYTANNTTYALSGIGIDANKKGKAAINVKGDIEVTLTPTKTTYQWDIDKKQWVKVTGDLFPANASDTGIEVSSNDVEVKGGDITKGADKIGDHKVFTIVTPNKTTVCPENCVLSLDDKCTYAGKAIIDNNINSAVKNVGIVDPVWFTVKAGADTYTWKKSGSATTTNDWVLVK